MPRYKVLYSAPCLQAVSTTYSLLLLVFLVPYTRPLLTTKSGLGPTPGTKFVICLLVIVSHTMHNLYKAMSCFYTWTTFSLPKLILHQTTFGNEKLSAPTNLILKGLYVTQEKQSIMLRSWIELYTYSSLIVCTVIGFYLSPNLKGRAMFQFHYM